MLTLLAHYESRLPPSSADVLLDQARRPTTLIPIRVELETDTHRIRDAFVWNLNEQIISPAAFARIFCADLDLPMHPYAEQVEGAIRSQIEEWEGVAAVELRPPLPQPSLDDEVTRFYSITNEVDEEKKVEEWELLGEEYREGEGEEVPDCRVILEVCKLHTGFLGVNANVFHRSMCRSQHSISWITSNGTCSHH